MNYNKISLILFSIVSPIVLVLLSYHAVLFFTPLSPAQEQVFNYLSQKTPLLSSITPAEISHLDDVRSVMIFLDILLYFSMLIVILILTYYRQNKEQLSKLFQFGGIITLCVLAILLVGIFFNFEQTFTLFHQIFFPQGNWQFAADSVLIQTFPIDFFISSAVNITVLAVLLSIILIGIAYWMKKSVSQN